MYQGLLNPSTAHSAATMSGKSRTSMDSFDMTSVIRTASMYSTPLANGRNLRSALRHDPGIKGLCENVSVLCIKEEEQQLTQS